jgi:hypothetical protein
MAGTGWLVCPGFSGRCAWAFDDETVLLTPEGQPPLALPLREIQGLGGDEYTIGLAADRQQFALSRLGGDGPPLRERLTRLWLPARAQALRIAGSGDAERFAGAVTTGGAARPFVGLLFEDVLAYATPGDDVEPFFLALLAGVVHDAAGYTVTASGWDGSAVVFSKLAGRTDAFAQGLAARRAGLAGEAAAALAAHLPTISLGPRAALSAAWPPGRMLPLAELERTAPGFAAAATSSWLPMLPRKTEGEVLLAWAESAFLGYSRSADKQPAPVASEEEPAARPPATSEPLGSASENTPAAPDDPSAPLWIMAQRGPAWLLECLSLTDHATYRFEGGDEMPALATRLLCAPQFSRTALYQPIESLVGDEAEFAVAARDLPFLAALRERFRGRIIHAGISAWTKSVAAPAGTS